MSPLGLMVAGGVLLAASCLLLLFMVIRVVPPHLVLSMVAYGASLGGLVIGIFGALGYARRPPRDSRG